MFGKWIYVNLGEGIECKVFVLCVPATPDDVLQTCAFSKLASRLTERAGGVAKASSERALRSANEAVKILQKIGDVKGSCNCGWVGTVDEAVPDVDGDGSLGCPECFSVMQFEVK